MLRDQRSRSECLWDLLHAIPIFFELSAHDRKSKGKSSVQSLFGAEHIPSDAQIRNLLDPQEPELPYGVFRKGHELLTDSGTMETFGSYAGQYLIPCDGTGAISLQRIRCEHCSQRALVIGSTPGFFQRFASAVA